MKLAFILFVFLSSLIPTWVGDEVEIDEEAAAKREEFEEVAKNAYDKYYVYKKEQNEEYVYEIIIGEYKNDQYFDIFLYNVTTNYALRISIDDIEYSVESLKNGDHYYFSTNSLQNSGNSTIEVYMVESIAKLNSVKIPASYESLASSIGEGKGVIVAYPEPIEGANKDFVVIISVSMCIIFVCLIGIGIFFVMKMGKKVATPMGYEKNLPHIDNFEVNNMFTQNTENDAIEIKVAVDDELKDSNIDTTKIDKQEEQTSVYDKSPKYSDEVEEPIKEANIESLLMMKGYKTDYSLMTEEEKNDVMVYLMILRKTEQIGYDQYTKEVIKLWKK